MDNLAWGLQITVVGMGLVFSLLALLWGLLTLVLRLDGAPAASPVPPDAAPSPAASAPAADEDAAGVDPAMAAAIALALALHRARQRGAAEPHMRIHWPGSLMHASRWVAAGRARQTRSWRRGE
jgi:Na+-transporting methylmalonyl-CoA/oxaloacetate decarboxylase gamma subunit